ncbi:hypothetical protein C6497_12885 [Candidatus Poribacteria bacterium]|nr:MAG: hypothetical protein C6497_12885 [Candidatus Poribacteria bacterium]
MMNIYKNDPKYKPKYKKTLCQKICFNMQDGIVKFHKDNKNTKSHFWQILKKLIQSGVKSVYDRGKRGNLHQFKSYKM